MRPIVLFGQPGVVGGGRTEAGDTALLWRKLGFPVTILPVFKEPENPWYPRLIEAGCVIKPEIKPDDLPRQAWLFRSTIVDFACERAARCWDRLARMGCRLIHVPCHCFPLPHEHEAFRHRPPTAAVFQSSYQKACMGPQYSVWGVPEEKQILVHGAFDPSPFRFDPRPHTTGMPFNVGRIARAVPSKWPKQLVGILRIANQETPINGFFLGWTTDMEPFTGPLPDYVHYWIPGALPVPGFLRGLHALLCISHRQGPAENWSRVALEAMAAGVPVIADPTGGFCEMIQPGITGLWAETPEQAAAHLVRLATDEDLRLRIAEAARERLSVLADPETIGGTWLKLFSEFS